MEQKDLPAVMALAFLGDAVYSAYVRNELVACGISHAGELNRLSLSFVTAGAQAALVARIKDCFTPDEADVFRRAANHKGLRPPHHTSGADYRAATGWEAVLGALVYTKNEARLQELLRLSHQGLFPKPSFDQDQKGPLS